MSEKQTFTPCGSKPMADADLLRELASRFAPGCIRSGDTLQMEPFTHAELSAIYDALLIAATPASEIEVGYGAALKEQDALDAVDFENTVRDWEKHDRPIDSAWAAAVIRGFGIRERQVQPSDKSSEPQGPFPLPPDAEAAIRELAEVDRALSDVLGEWPVKLHHTDQEGSPLADDLTRAGAILLCLQKASMPQSAIAAPTATPWDQCQFEIVAWEINEGHIGISVKHAKGGSAWVVKPHEHVEKLLTDGLRYRFLQVHGAALAGSEALNQGLVHRCVNLDEAVDAAMRAAADSRSKKA